MWYDSNPRCAPGAPLTRRQVLAAGAAAAALTASSGFIRSAGALARPGKTPSGREEIYKALVEAVGVLPDNQVDPARSAEAATRFGQVYGDQLPERQREIDALLDRIERGAPGGSFTALDPGARLDFLRSWSRSQEARSRRTDADAAVALAAQPFYPDPEDFHPTPVVI